MLNYAGKCYSKYEVIEILVLLGTGSHASLKKKSDAFLKLTFFRYFDSVVNLPDEVNRALDVLGSVDKKEEAKEDDKKEEAKKTTKKKKQKKTTKKKKQKKTTKKKKQKKTTKKTSFSSGLKNTGKRQQ